MRHLDDELLGILSGEPRRESVRGVEVDRVLHALEGAKNCDDINGLVANIGRLGVLEDRAA